MIDHAFDILSSENKAMKFLDLWAIVSKNMGYTPSQANENIAHFYSNLSIDGRFASLPGNTWDLRKRQSSAHTIVDTDSLSVEDDEDFEPEEDETETKDSGDEDEE